MGASRGSNHSERSLTMRKQLAKPPKPPNRNYRDLKNLDAQGWLKELTRLFRLSVDHDLRLCDVQPNMFVFCEWGKPGQTFETSIGFIGTPTVQFIGARSTNFCIPPERCPALIINVHAPDSIILSEVKLWLSEIRKHLKPPVAKRGRYQLNSAFDATTFSKWRVAKIVEFAELLAWRATLDANVQSQIPDHLLGAHAGLADAKATSNARKVLKEALDSLPSLSAQVAHGVAQNKKEAIAADVAKYFE